VRDLTYPLGGWDYSGFMVDVTPDGSVWMSVDEGDHGLFRLGEEPVFEDPWTHLRSREVAPDGSLWAIGIGGVPGDRDGIFSFDAHSGIFSFDGEGWTMRATTTGDPHVLAVGPDGTVWVLATDLLRLEDDGSLTTIEAWSDVYGGDAKSLELAVTPDGNVWLVGTPRGYDPDGVGGELLLRFDGEGWARIPGPIPGPEGWEPGHMGRGLLDVGADGALWVKASRTSVARFDDPGWTTFTEADGVKPWGVPDDAFTDLLEVAVDGSLWLIGTPTEEPWDCCGVSHYDGTTWTSYLVGSLVHDFAIAPDGSVWLGAHDVWLGAKGMANPLGLYVITPEAVAATEQ
jgi:streptogramin lyase